MLSRGRFRGWLRTVTANSVRDMVASRRRRATAAGGDEHNLALQRLADDAAVEDLWTTVEAEYRRELLEAAEHRVQMRVMRHTWDAYQMAAVEQVPASEVAERLGIGVSDVYVAKSRVIKLLRQEVSRMDADND